MKKVPNYKNSVKSNAQEKARKAFVAKVSELVEACKKRQQLAGTVDPEERLRQLDEKLGAGQGAKRERVRLQKLISERSR